MARIIWEGFKKAWPILVSLAVAITKLSLMAIGAWTVGVGVAVSRIRDEAIKAAGLSGVPSEWDNFIRHGATVLTVVELVIGWTVMAYLTTWTVGWILFR